MAYETGSATGINDLLDKLRLFAAANGWTVNKWATQGTGYYLAIQKSTDLFFNIISDLSAGTSLNPGYWLRACGSVGYSAGAAWNAQAGTSGESRCNALGAGAMTSYHFFAGTDYLYAAIEATPGVYRHLQMGRINKIGSYTGGAFLMATSHSWTNTNQLHSDHHAPWSVSAAPSNTFGFVRADIGSSNKWYSTNISATQNIRARFTGWNMNSAASASFGNILGTIGPNLSNGLATFLPVMVFVDNSFGLYHPIGSAPDIRMLRVDDYDPGELVTIGGVDWMIFPVREKPLAGGASYGYAIRKIV